MPESRDKSRNSFEEVAKLATLSETSTGLADDAEANSGMINLAAIAAGAPFARAASRSPVPPERGQRLVDPPDTPSSSPMSLGPPSTPRLSPPPAPGPMRQGPPPPPPRREPMDAVSGLTARFPSASMLLQQLDAAPLPGPGLKPRASAPLPPIAPPPSISTAPTPLSLETNRPTVMATQPALRRGGRLTWVALAAGAGLGLLVVATRFVHTRSMDAAPSAHLLAAPPAETASSWSPSRASDSASTDEERGSAPRVDMGPRVVEPTALPLAPPPAPAASVAAQGTARPAAPRATASAASGAATAESATAAMAASTPPPAADPAEQSLEALMRKAVGATAKAASPVAPSPTAAITDVPKATAAGNLPQKPAMGAVQGALGAVLPATRYCLGPDDPISHASITFKSDGTVQSVSVTGDAAGQPSEACIRARLMTTRVPPFSNPIFTWTVTVRPAS